MRGVGNGVVGGSNGKKGKTQKEGQTPAFPYRLLNNALLP
jgi:hypothetical protein